VTIEQNRQNALRIRRRRPL